MTPMAPEVRKMMGAKEPMGMTETLMAGASLITRFTYESWQEALAKGDAVDEAVDLLKGFKSTEDVEATDQHL